jgi:hypothetical protein
VHAANGTSAQQLEVQTAKQWAAMVAAAKRDGVTLQPEADDGVPSCYRNLAGQLNAWRIYQRDGEPSAAVPGTSNHGWGTAVDIVITPETLAWLRKHAAAYGFDNADGAQVGENWHWVRTETITPPIKPAKPEEEDDDVKSFLIWIRNKNGSMQWAQISADLKSFVPIWKSETANGLSAGGPQTGPAVQVVKEEWNGYRAAAGLEPDDTVG